MCVCDFVAAFFRESLRNMYTREWGRERNMTILSSVNKQTRESCASRYIIHPLGKF